MDSAELLLQVEHEGFAVIPDIDVSSVDAAGNGLAQHIQMLARPVSYFDQPLIMDVKPQANYQPVSSGGRAYFGLHTGLTFHDNPPELLGLLCIDNDNPGGDSLIVDGYKVLEEMSDDLDALRNTDITFPTPAHVAGESVVKRIVSGDPDRPVIRFRSDLALEAGAETPELIQRFSSIAHAAMRTVHLSPGDLLLVDNHRTLHGRTEISANPSRRHLLRMYGSNAA